MKKLLSLFLIICIIFSATASFMVFAKDEMPMLQKTIRKVEKMPNSPSQYKMLDWKQMTIDLDAYLFDFSKTKDFTPVDIEGETYLPVGFWDDSHTNIDTRSFGMPAYIGYVNQDGGGQFTPGTQDGMTTIQSVISPTLVGIDKSNQNGYNFVDMVRQLYNKKTGANLVLNGTQTTAGYTFWYEVYPFIQFLELTYLYPGNEEMERISLEGIGMWNEATKVMLADPKGFEYVSFDFKTMKPVAGRWMEPNVASGLAFVLYAGYKKTGNEGYLQNAIKCMKWLDKYPHNPYYEMLCEYAPYMAVVFNAEFGQYLDEEKMVNWQFDADSIARRGMGVIADKWGDYEVNGIVGGSQEYAFVMNTYSLVSALVPSVRYDQSYARAVGKWVLNAANNSRLFYPKELPAKNQSCDWYKYDPQGLVPYEGLRNIKYGKNNISDPSIAPYAMGDPLIWGWAKTDLGIYGGSHVGIMGGIIKTTNVEKILQLDCLKTDYFRSNAYPTYLYYNPYSEDKSVEITVNEASDLYDAVSKKFVAKNISGKTSFTVPADNASVIVIVPANSETIKTGRKVSVNNIPIAYYEAVLTMETGIPQGGTVEGTLNFKINSQIPVNDSIKKAAIKFNGKELYSGTTLPKEFAFDSKKVNNAYGDLEVIVETSGGLKDRTSQKVNVFNVSGEVVLSAMPAEIETWGSAKIPGTVSLENGKAVITETNPSGEYGGISTPTLQMDLDRSPTIMIDIDSVNPSWFMQLKVANEEWGFYVRSTDSSTGKVVIDLVAAVKGFHTDFKYSGIQDVQIWIMPIGKEGATLTLNKVDIIYNDSEISDTPTVDSNDWKNIYTGVDIAKWEGFGAIGVESVGNAVITEKNSTQKNIGGLSSGLLNINFDNQPNMTVEVVSASELWCIQMLIPSVNRAYYIQGDTDKTGKFTYDLLSEIKKTAPSFDFTGKQQVKIRLLVIGTKPGATLMVKEVAMGYGVAESEKVISFTDINDHWAQKEIEAMYKVGIVKGVTSTMFAPEQNVTRAEFAVMLKRVLGTSDIEYKNIYNDVKQDDWFATAVLAMTDLGIIKGSGDAKFNPNAYITREEIAVMMIRALKDDVSVGMTMFSDEESISDWAKDSVAKAVGIGLMNGKSTTTFAPNANATRAETAVILKRFMARD